MPSVIRGNDDFDSLLDQLDLAHSFTGNGYQKLGNGLIIQWGTFSIPSSSSITVTFPVAFPNAVLHVSTTCQAGINTVAYTPISNTQVQLDWNGSGFTMPGNWYVIGY